MQQHVLHQREEFHGKTEQIKSGQKKLKEKGNRKERKREKNIKEDRQKSEFANFGRKENLPMMQDWNRKEVVQLHRHFLYEWLRKGLGPRSPPHYRNHRNQSEHKKTFRKRRFSSVICGQAGYRGHEEYMADLADGLAKVKGAKSTDQRAAYCVARALAFGASVKKNRPQSRVSKLVGIKRQQVSKGISQREKVLKGDEACWIVTKRKVG